MMRLSVILAALAVAGCGGPPAARPLPEIIIGPKLKAAGVTFGPWEEKPLSYVATMEIPEDGEALAKDSVKVKCQGKGGLVMKDGQAFHAPIQPGEKTKITVWPSSKDDLESVTLDLE